jgi:hypothetical protein
MRKGKRVKTGARSAGALSLESPVSQLPLTGKERGALRALGVFTVREFFELDVPRVLTVRGYGVGTYERLDASQEALREKLLPDQGDADEIGLLLRKSVAELELSVRGLKALARLRIDTVADFLKVDLEKPPLIRNCGSVTVRALADLQWSLRQRLPSDIRASLIEDKRAEALRMCRLAAARSPMTASSWKLLPFFSGELLNGIRADELHASYCPDVPIGYLRLGKKCDQVLTAAGVTSLGELLLTPHDQLRGGNKLSGASLARLQAIVNKFLSGLAEHASRKVDYSTPEAFLASLVAPVFSDERERRVFLERIAWRATRRTLAALGREYGVTRERIRQIEKRAQKKLTHWRARSALAPLHDFVRSLLSEDSPRVSLALICERLQDQYQWPRPLETAALGKLLPAFPNLKSARGEYVCLSTFRWAEGASPS